MKRSILIGLFSLACAAPSMKAQGAPTGVWLEWTNAGLTLYPDSTGVYLWARIHTAPGQKQPFFTASFDPANLEKWLPIARGFNNQPIATSSDTARFRSSPMLQSIIGDAIHLVRRREGDVWSDERFLVMESIKDNVPVVFTGNEKSVGQVLDSLEAVTRRTRFSASAAQREISETILGQYDREASASPSNQPPMYPMNELRARQNGMVVASFFVDAEGKAEMATARILFSSAPSFAQAVLSALPSFQFFPAEKDGKKVRSKAVMPFAFSVSR